ncbi:hypothetical protein BGZ75_006636 [Mortierella antarctica]|nr:hypothetical protein BGZ75_006636 [Mortierella antarctica]
MKNLFGFLLIATVALASSVSAQEVHQAEAPITPEVAAPEAPVASDGLAPTVTSEGEDAMWFKHKKHHKHGKHGKHGKHRKHKNTCCIKYVTITSVPECKPEPSICAKPQAESEAAVAFDPVEAPVPAPAPALL